MKIYQDDAEIEQVLNNIVTNTKECEDFLGFNIYMLEEDVSNEIAVIGWYNGKPRKTELKKILGDIQRRNI